MTSRTPNRTAGKVRFVRPCKDVDDYLEGFVFLAMELEKILPAEKRRTPNTKNREVRK